MLTVSGLSKSFGGRTLFSDISLQLSTGRKVALVGGNGVGKTTILEIIVGQQDADSGEVSKPKGFKIGYLPQELLEAWQGTVLQEVMRGDGEIVALETKLRELEHAMQNPEQGSDPSGVIEKYGEVQARYETSGGYLLEAEARRILGGLGFTSADMDRPLKDMSGGWQMRASLARLMLQKPDVLVLDEPTNHLDVDSVKWLEQQLDEWSGALLFVSHDRDFIDAVANRVIEIAWGKASEYIGGFAEFVVQREERLANLESAAARQSKEVERVEKFISRFRYKSTKAKQVQSRIKTLEKLERIQAPKIEELKLKFDFPEPPRSARLVLEVAEADIGYGEEVLLNGVSFAIERGTKMAVLGPNGSGKSTLIKAVMGELEPSAGRVTIGNNVSFSYFAQHHVDALDLSLTVAQEFRHKVGEQPKNRNMRTVLGSFGFSGDAADRIVEDLSGGERTRLALAEIMCDPVNMLILDEPTNHLDLASCDILEDAINAYPGTVLLVSHDRYLIRNTMSEMLDVRDGKVKHRFDLTSLESQNSAENMATKSAPTSSLRPSGTKKSASKTKPSSGKASPSSNNGSLRKQTKREEAENRNELSRKTRDMGKQVSRLENQIQRAEAKTAELETQLADPQLYEDKEKSGALVDEYNIEKTKLDKLVTNWETATMALEEVSNT